MPAGYLRPIVFSWVKLCLWISTFVKNFECSPWPMAIRESFRPAVVTVSLISIFGNPNLASSATTRMLQLKANSHPPPRAYPRTVVIYSNDQLKVWEAFFDLQSFRRRRINFQFRLVRVSNARQFMFLELDLTGIDVIICDNFEKGGCLTHADIRIPMQSLLQLF